MRQNNGYIGIINKYDISFGLADFSLRSTIKCLSDQRKQRLTVKIRNTALYNAIKTENGQIRFKAAARYIRNFTHLAI